MTGRARLLAVSGAPTTVLETPHERLLLCQVVLITAAGLLG